MNESSDVAYAEIADKHLKLIAIAALSAGLTYSLSAALKIGIELGGVVRGAEIVSAIVAMAIVFPICIWKFSRLDIQSKKKYLKMEGFVFDAFKRSITTSWIVSFFFMVGMKMVIKGRYSEVPHGFFTELTLCVMLGVFGVAFLVLNRNSTKDEDDLGMTQ